MNKSFLIGVDLGGTNLKTGLVNMDGKILKKIIADTGESKDIVLKQIVEAIENIISKTGKDKSEIIGIGIGSPGLVDSEKGIIHGLTNIKGFENVHMKEYVESALDIPTSIDNDVNVMAYGELKCGAGKDAMNIVCLTLGTGVGGGIIIDGNIYRGSSLSAGEIGHIPVNVDGPKCICSGRACLESYIGKDRIIKRTIEKLIQRKESMILKLVDGDLEKITPKIVYEAAEKGDMLAIEIWKETAQYLATALTGVINFLNPEIIVIGGGIANAGKYIFDPLRDMIKKRVFPFLAEKIQIVHAQLGDEAGVVGSAMLAKNNISKSESS
ncbi:ROK family glucokinase [bacterium]|nr:ROK family glucokinase [bacterium]